MSDFENDLECLEIHLGTRLNISDSSDSGDNNELDEEYHLLRPLPISAEVIRQKSIYRPPSPKDELSCVNLPVLYGSLAVSKMKKTSTKNVQGIVNRKQANTSFTTQERMLVLVKIADDLIKVQHEMYSDNGKLSLAYLDALDKFRINLDCFGNSLKNLNSKKSDAICSIAPSDVIVNLENNIDNFRTLLSNLYAFTLSESLHILIELSRFNRSKVSSIVIKTLDLIENFGSLNEIRNKIQFRNLKNLDDLNFGSLVVVQSTNEEIVNKLNILFPESDESKKTKRKRIRKKKVNKIHSDKNYIALIAQKTSPYVEKTQEKLEKASTFLAKLNTQAQVNSSSFNGNVVNFKYSVACQSTCDKLLTNPLNSPVLKTKRKKRKRGKATNFSIENDCQKCIATEGDQNLREIKTVSHFSCDHNNKASVLGHILIPDFENNQKVATKLTNIVIDPDEIFTKDKKYRMKKSPKENVVTTGVELNDIGTNSNNVFSKYSVCGTPITKIDPSKITGHEKFNTRALVETLENIKGETYEANIKSDNEKKKIVITKGEDTQIVESRIPLNHSRVNSKKNISTKENCSVIESGYQLESVLIDSSKYNTKCNIESKMYSELSRNEQAISAAKNVCDEQKDKYNLGGADNATESIMGLVQRSNTRVISLLNTLHYSIVTFEKKYSTAGFEAIKDCLKVLHYIFAFNDLLFKLSTHPELAEIEKYYLPTSNIYQAHFYAFIISLSTEFIRSLKTQRGENEAKVLYSELLEFTDMFGTSEDINQKLHYRNDDCYIDKAQQACSIIPVSYISASNEVIVENIKSIRKAKKQFTLRPIEVVIHHLKLPAAAWIPNITEFDNLHFDVEKIEMLLGLQNDIWNSDQCLSKFHSKFENLNQFCVILKNLEECEKMEPKFGKLFHTFLHKIDSILSLHILRILLSQFYTFIFNIFSIFFSTSLKLESKKDAKSLRNNLLNLLSSVCPIEQIPEKLLFRNDDLFLKYTNAFFNIKGIVINKSSTELCKEIAGILKTNKQNLEKLTDGYTFLPTEFKIQISKLEGKMFSLGDLFNICIYENKQKKIINFKAFALDIMQRKTVSMPIFGKSLHKHIEINNSITCIEDKDFQNLSVNGVNSVLEPEITNFSNCISANESVHFNVQLSEENYQISEFGNKSIVKSNNSVISENVNKKEERSTETFTSSLEYNMKAINVLNVLQYAIGTFEMKYSKSAIEVLKDCFKILKSISMYNNSLLKVSSTECVKDIEECYLPISELCQAHFYAYIFYFCCFFAKTFKNRLIQEESKKMYIKWLKIIEAWTPEDIYNKLKCRNDHLYIELAQKVCSIIPVICTPSSNAEIMQEFLHIRNLLESHTNRFQFELINVIQVKNIEAVVNTGESQKFYEIQNLQFDLKKIEVLSILQYNIHHSDMYSSEVQSIFESMKNFLVILTSLEKSEKIEPERGSVQEGFEDLNAVLNRHVLRIFVSQFYSFYLHIFLEYFHRLHSSSTTKEIDNTFHFEMFSLLISICPLEKLLEKLQYRNDAIYSKHSKALFNIEAFVVYKSSHQILQETLDIFNSNTKYLEQIYGGTIPWYFCTQLFELETNILWTKELILTSLEQSEPETFEGFKMTPNKNLSPLEEVDKVQIELTYNKDEVESRNITTISENKIEYSVEKDNYLSFVKLDVEDIIIQIMNNQKDADIAMNSIMRRIEYSNFKTISVLNVLQYSFDTFEVKYSLAALEAVMDCLKVLHYVRQFSNLLLSVSSSIKLQEIEISYLQVSEMYQAYFYAYILSISYEFIRVLRPDENRKETTLYSKVLEMVKAFGSPEEIYEKLKCRNDCLYIGLVNKLCCVIPSTLILPNNDYILRNIQFVQGSLEENKVPFEFIITKYPEISMEHKLKGCFNNSNLEFECSYLDLNKIKLLTELQYDIHFHDRYPTTFCLVFENIMSFFVILKNFELVEIQLSECGNFVDSFLENLDVTLSLHISRILVSQFYSFIFSTCIYFLNKLSEFVSKNEVPFFHLKLINLLSSNCPIDQILEKIQFRNDMVYMKYIGDILKMKVVEVTKSYGDILSEIRDIFKNNMTYIENNSTSNLCLFTDLNNENLQNGRNDLSKLNSYLKVLAMNPVDNSQFTVVRNDAFKIISKRYHHLRKKSQNIYLSFQGHNEDCKFMILNFVNEIFAQNKIKDDIYLSISTPKSPESHCKYINYNNEKRIFEQNRTHFSMIFECSVTEEFQIIFWINLLQFAQKQELDEILSEISSETKKTFDKFLNNFQTPHCGEVDGNEEKIKILLELTKKVDYEERHIIQFHSFSGIMLSIISREFDQLITTQNFPDISEMTLLFKEIFLCILKRIKELSKIYCTFLDCVKVCKTERNARSDSLIQAYRCRMEKMESIDNIFILHRKNQYFSLREILEFLMNDENTTSRIMALNLERMNSYFFRFLSWFDVVIFESHIPFGYFENVHQRLIKAGKSNREIDKIGLFLQKHSYTNMFSTKYRNPVDFENSFKLTHMIEKKELDISERVHENACPIENGSQSESTEKPDVGYVLQIAFEWSVIFLVFNLIIKSYFFYITVIWIVMFHLQSYSGI